MTGGLEVREGVPLAGMTTLGIGGPARFFARLERDEQVPAAVAWASARGVPLLVVGGGSNLLVADEGFPGLVAHVAIGGIRYGGEGPVVDVEAGAGESWDGLVAVAVARGLAGVECLSGIPGLVGATPIQNVGAYGQEVRETIAGVRAYDVVAGETVAFDNAACRFGYRESRFKLEDRGRYVVLGVTYRLAAGGASAVRYPELVRYLDENGDGARSLDAVREAVLAVRRRKSMVLDASDPDARSAGSFFVNPVVPEAVAGRIGGDEMPRYPAEGGVKLSAAWLIERAGFARGYTRGAAGLSSKHTLAIVNRGGATAHDVAGLAREIRDRVAERFGVTLTPEPVFVGVEW
jgi:UDP-N-acetylmuramate dehydrogenase